MTEAIKTRRLTLRGAEESDRAAIADALSDFEVSKWLVSVPHPFGLGDVKIRDEEGNSSWPAFAAIDLEGKVIGSIRRGARTGYWLGRKYWGHGYMAEALAAVFDADFATGIDEIRAGIFKDNSVSLRLAKRLGFERSDTAPTRILSRARGEELVSEEYVLTRDRWEALV